MPRFAGILSTSTPSPATDLPVGIRIQTRREVSKEVVVGGEEEQEGRARDQDEVMSDHILKPCA